MPTQSAETIRAVRQSIWSLVTALTLAAVLTVAWLLGSLSVTTCDFSEPGKTSEFWFQAVEVVVRPWMGRHQVYGVFIIPDRLKHHGLYSVTLRIEGIESEFLAGSPENEDIESTIPAGHYLRRAYIPTRTALWFLFTGRLGVLRVPCHWWLVYKAR
jgi:hypothetical protein